MRVAFCWEWTNTLDVIARFDEGLGEVLRMLGKEHEVRIFTWGGPIDGKDLGVSFTLIPPELGHNFWRDRIVDFQPDLVLGWGSIDHKIFPRVREVLPTVPIFLFLAGGGVEHENLKVFDGFFVETNLHVNDLNRHGKSAWRALGVMTDLLKPRIQPKIWDVFLPASFTPNKRYDVFCDTVERGFSGVAVGPENYEGCRIECEKVGVSVFGYVSRGVLRDFYCASRVTVLTGGAWGGSQRTLLESLACGTPVVACDDNFQLDWLVSAGAPVVLCPPQPALIAEEVHKLIKNPPPPEELRDFVLKNFTSQHYFDVVQGVLKEKMSHAAS